MPASLRQPAQVLLAALVLGLLADYLFYDRSFGISAPLFAGMGLAALAALSTAERRTPTRANLWLAAGALVFAACLAWRASATLTTLNALAVLGMLALLASSYRGAALARQPVAHTIAQLIAGLSDMAFQPAAAALYATRQRAATPTDRRVGPWLRPIGCGLLLALPVLFIFTGLLMSADSIFASYVEQILSFDLPLDLTQLIGHAFFVAAATWACAGGLLVALLGDERSGFGRAFGAVARALIGLIYIDPAEAHAIEDLPAEGDTQRLRMPRQAPIGLGAIEALTVLVLVDLLFGGFMAIQGAYFFGGLDTLARTGMTYAEYARRGFFELLAVACLALGLLCTLAIITRRPVPSHRRAFNAACTAMIALVLGLLASAFQRMQLYEHAYGYTELRIYTHSFMIWLAVVLALFVVALLRGRPQVFTFGGLVSLVAYVLVLNLANPDALIVRENIGRSDLSAEQQRGGEQVDTYYLTQLSPDATPALVAALSQLDDRARQDIADALAQQYWQLAEQQQRDGWPGWHLGRASAQWAIEAAGLAKPIERR